MRLKFGLKLKVLILFFLVIFCCPAFSDSGKPLSGQVSDPLVEAQEKLLHAKGSYKTIKSQEDAIQDMRKATRLSLKAARLRTQAEKLQARADLLVNKANQQALSRGLYITNPLAPVMMQAPPVQQEAKAQTVIPVPGQPVNIIIPKQEEVSFEGSSDGSNSPPVPGF